MTTITKYISFTNYAIEIIWDFINQGHFYPINQSIQLTIIPLSGTHGKIIHQYFLFAKVQCTFQSITPLDFQTMFI
jgi:hypothetical protein